MACYIEGLQMPPGHGQPLREYPLAGPCSKAPVGPSPGLGARPGSTVSAVCNLKRS